MIKLIRLLFPLAALVLISVFHFISLNYKDLWLDEMLSLIYASGKNHREVFSHFFDSSLPFRSTDIREYLSQSGSIGDVLENLARHYPLQAPLYYILLNGWIKTFGIEAFALGSLSVMLHLILIPLATYFFRLMFEEKRVWLLATVLVAIGPIEVSYAREARPYMLLMVAFFALNLCFLVALRRNSRKLWAAYAIVLILTFYTSLLAISFWAAHILYLLFSLKKIKSFQLKAFAVASAVAGASVVPWVYLGWNGLINGIDSQVAWMKDPINGSAFYWWKYNTLWFFFREPQIGLHHPNGGFVLGALFILLITFYRVFRNSPSAFRGLLVSSLLTSTLPLLLWDILFGGIHSAMLRYQISSFLLVQAGIAWMLVKAIGSVHPVSQKVGWLGLYGVLFLNLLWNFQYCAQPTHPNYRLRQFNDFIRRNPSSMYYVLVPDFRINLGRQESDVGETLSMLYNAPSTAQIKWIKNDFDAKLIKGKKNYLYLPTGSEQIGIQIRGFPFGPQVEGLWRLE